MTDLASMFAQPDWSGMGASLTPQQAQMNANVIQRGQTWPLGAPAMGMLTPQQAQANMAAAQPRPDWSGMDGMPANPPGLSELLAQGMARYGR